MIIILGIIVIAITIALLFVIRDIFFKLDQIEYHENNEIILKNIIDFQKRTLKDISKDLYEKNQTLDMLAEISVLESE